MAKKADKKAADTAAADTPAAPAKAARKPAAKAPAAAKAAEQVADAKPAAKKAKAKVADAPVAKSARAAAETAAAAPARKASAAKKAAESAPMASKRPVAAAVLEAGRYQPAAAAPSAVTVGESASGRLLQESRRPANPNAINGTPYHRPDRDAIRTPYAPKSAPFAEASFDIPHGYNRTRISVLVRDPEWIFVFWDIAEATRAELGLNRPGAAGLMLRLHDTTGVSFNGRNAVSTEDIPVNSGAASWYVHVPGKGRRYTVDLGMLGPDGSFHLIARSQAFDMPRAEVSNDIEWNLNERNEEEHLQILRMSGGTTMPARLSSADFVSQLQTRLLKDSAGFSGGFFSGSLVSSEFASATFIHRAREEKRGRNFWLVVDAEVIVYGATEPDADVRFMGKPIKLNPDGTFGIRMALPDGRIDFPVEATSRDREETLVVCPVVERATKR